MQQNTSVYSGFCPVHASYTANTAKQRTGLYRRFSCGLSHFTAADARPAQAAIYHLRHARAYHSAVAPPTRARYHSRAGTLDRPAQTAYYNKVYKSAETHLLWIHARQCSILQTMQARQGLRLRLYMISPATCNLVPGQQSWRGGRRGTIDSYRRISFRAFAR